MSRSEGVPLRGYRKKPRAIAVIAAIFLLIPLAWAAQILIQSGGGLHALQEALGSRYFLQEWAFSWSAAAAIFIVSRWSFAYFAVLSGYALATKIAHLATHPFLETPASLLLTCVWFAAALAVLGSTLRTPYLNPRLRWWTRPRRMALSRNAALLSRGARIPITVLNLSEGGAFVKLDSPPPAGSGMPHRLGEECGMTMTLDPGDEPPSVPAQFESNAKIVWMGKPESPYRDGLGIQFSALSRARRRQLKHFLHHEAHRTHSPCV